MKKLTKSIFALLLVLSMFLMMDPAEPTSAKSLKTQNKEAKSLLAKQVKNKFCQYAYADIDNDGISELVVREFSGKFIDGCDKEMSVSIYKVVKGKVKQIFTDSFEGDFFHPTISCDIYYKDTSYVLVTKSHEGYFIQTLYKYTKKGFEEAAYVEEDSCGDGRYYFGGSGNPVIEYEAFNKPDFDALLSSFDKCIISLKYKNCKVKVANKYLKKMLKAEFKYQCKIGVFDKNIVSTVYDDLDGDGISEMIVREGPTSGVILYAYIPEFDINYYIGKTEYTINNGKISYEIT